MRGTNRGCRGAWLSCLKERTKCGCSSMWQWWGKNEWMKKMIPVLNLKSGGVRSSLCHVPQVVWLGYISHRLKIANSWAMMLHTRLSHRAKKRGMKWGVRKRCRDRDRGEKRKKTQRGLLAKLSHCDSKSSFNKVHAVYNFIIFSWMIITLFNHVQGFSES